MGLTRVPRLEIESLAQFDDVVRDGPALRGWTIQDVDLNERTAVLERLDVGGALFLGCAFTPAAEQWVMEHGGLVFPRLPGTPFDPYRPSLYLARDLYDTPVYAHTLDARVYAWYAALPDNPPVESSLAMTLHDAALLEALGDRLDDHPPIVGVMGGHALNRGTAEYAAAAHLGSQLAGRGLMVATGGGPGAMEAANLGARAGSRDLGPLLTALGRCPDFRADIGTWAATALAVEEDLPPGPSLGIPTWYYGHEPPNVFANMIAKLFSNAIREDLLLRLCRVGLIFLPGEAGTVQEIFQAATASYYTPAGVIPAPMIFVGRRYWSRTLPVYPLLEALAAGRPMQDKLSLVDSPDEAADLVSRR